MPSWMDDDESVVERGTDKKRRDTQRTLGDALPKSTDLSAPKAAPGQRENQRPELARRPTGRGSQRAAPGAVGLRAATQRLGDPERAGRRRLDSQRIQDESRDERKKAVWDKLDSAKQKADEKASRLKSFEPAKPGAEDRGQLDGLLDGELDEDLDQEIEGEVEEAP